MFARISVLNVVVTDCFVCFVCSAAGLHMYNRASTCFTPAVDEQLMKFVDKQAQRAGVSVLKFKAESFVIPEDFLVFMEKPELLAFVSEAGSPLTVSEVILARVAFLIEVNKLYQRCLKLVITGAAGYPLCMSTLIGATGHMYFPEVKVRKLILVLSV